jgi:hypothetical protein
MSTAAIAASPSPAVEPVARSRSVRWALARVEGRRLITHPIFMLGMATSATALALASGRLPIGAADRSESVNMLAGDCFVMLGGAFWTFLVAFLAASRERRDGAQDFYAGQAVTPRLRIEAMFLSLGCAGLAGAALIAAAALVLVGVDGTLVGAHARYVLDPGDLAQGPLYLVLAGALGVLAGSWTRHVYAGVFLAIALFLPPIALLPVVVYDDTLSGGYYGAVYAGAPFGSQTVGIAALVVLAAAGAMARHDRRPRIVLLALVALGVAAIALGLPQGPTSPGVGPPPGAGP